ncbi:hypothetical protein [Streptomyces sp. NBC_01497]|uniref:hypothetical protein n=1 Tax=Streptomyces sp. NBC_01497 TaxID=2903885 RepID=UPI002E380597|nr:hypothetical protein [Streptomyces sp. NBC_01497]
MTDHTDVNVAAGPGHQRERPTWPQWGTALTITLTGLYAISMAVMLEVTVYPALHGHGLSSLEAAGIPLFCVVTVGVAAALLELMPSNLWGWLLLVVAAAPVGYFNYLMFGHPVKGDAWVGLGLVTLVELAPWAVLGPVWIRLSTGMTGFEIMRRPRA